VRLKTTCSGLDASLFKILPFDPQAQLYQKLYYLKKLQAPTFTQRLDFLCLRNSKTNDIVSSSHHRARSMIGTAMIGRSYTMDEVYIRSQTNSSNRLSISSYNFSWTFYVYLFTHQNKNYFCHSKCIPCFQFQLFWRLFLPLHWHWHFLGVSPPMYSAPYQVQHLMMALIAYGNLTILEHLNVLVIRPPLQENSMFLYCSFLAPC
jgi:hypothetical protein